MALTANQSSVDEGLKSELAKKGIVVTTMNQLYNWGRRSSIWPMQFGLACCAIEMIATACARYDIARFGAELFRPSPRQSDMMIVAIPLHDRVSEADNLFTPDRVDDIGRQIQQG